jgi:hypothetical protein
MSKIMFFLGGLLCCGNNKKGLRKVTKDFAPLNCGKVTKIQGFGRSQ